MKRILFAAGLIVAAQAAAAGPIADKQNACNARAMVVAQACINAATTQEGETLCKISGKMSAHACAEAALAEIPLNPYDEY
jgi:hypothetical protein